MISQSDVQTKLQNYFTARVTETPAHRCVRKLENLGLIPLRTCSRLTWHLRFTSVCIPGSVSTVPSRLDRALIDVIMRTRHECFLREHVIAGFEECPSNWSRLETLIRRVCSHCKRFASASRVLLTKIRYCFRKVNACLCLPYAVLCTQTRMNTRILSFVTCTLLIFFSRCFAEHFSKQFQGISRAESAHTLTSFEAVRGSSRNFEVVDLSDMS